MSDTAEYDFFYQLSLHIHANEPIIWVQTQDVEWILDYLKNNVKNIGRSFEICDTIDFEKLEKAKLQESPLIIWANPTQEALDKDRIHFQKQERILEPRYSILILGNTALSRPEFLSSVPILRSPLPSMAVRRDIAQHLLGTRPEMAQRIERVAISSAGLTRTQLFRVLKRCQSERLIHPEFDAWERTITNEKKQLLAENLSLDVIDDATTLDDVGGAEELKLWLNQRALAYTQKAADFGIQPPRGLLLVGIQGCGKSLLAKSIANFWKFPLLQLDMSAIFASTERPDAVLRQALQVADAMSPAVIWCDEIEKAFAQDADPTTRRLLGHILNWLQERKSASFFVATANDIQQLPAELMRKGRFDEVFFLDLPSFESRIDIFKIHLRKRARDPQNFDLNRLAAASENYAGAEIEQAVIAALFAAFEKNRDIQTGDILDAIHDIVPLFKQREHDIKRLREWAGERTRQAAGNERILSYFS